MHICCYEQASTRTFLIPDVSFMHEADMLISGGPGLNMSSLCVRMFISHCFMHGCLNMVSLPQHPVSCQSHSASPTVYHLGSVPGQIAAAGARLDNLRPMLANLLTIGPTRTKLMHCITLSCFKVCLNSCSIMVPQTNLLAAS